MSINWVMLDASHRLVPLPQERILYTSLPRTALALDAGNSNYPGKEPLAITCSNGTAFITNQRLVYLPAKPTPSFQSFSVPILNLQDTHVSAPFFGPNVWYAVLQPVPGGGIAPHHSFVKLKITFKEGGAFDFSTIYEQIKENLSHAVEIARENGQTADLADVDLEQLPAYEEIGADPPVAVPVPAIQQPTPISPRTQRTPSTSHAPTFSNIDARPDPARLSNQHEPPNEPPPGYEETEGDTIADQLEQRVRQQSHQDSS